MMLFTRLVTASTSNRQTVVRAELKQLGDAFLSNDFGMQEIRTTQAATYEAEEEILTPYNDRKRVRFHAYDKEHNKLLDSLILILPIDDEDTL